MIEESFIRETDYNDIFDDKENFIDFINDYVESDEDYTITDEDFKAGVSKIEIIGVKKLLIWSVWNYFKGTDEDIQNMVAVISEVDENFEGDETDNEYDFMEDGNEELVRDDF